MDFEEVLKKRHSVRKFQDRQIRQETLMQIVAQAFVKYPDIIRKHLDIPGSEEIVIGIGRGYEDEDDSVNKFRSPRKPLSTILTIKE